MADKKSDKDETKKENNPETVKGYSGSPHEGQKPAARPKEASADAVVSPLGHTEPSIEIREKSK
jgi:hypothetical protein